MYIRKTKTGASSNKNLYTHRVVKSFRTSENKVQQRTLLNLGANYCIPQEWWKLLCARIEEILNGQTTLIDTNEEIESEAGQSHRLLTISKDVKYLGSYAAFIIFIFIDVL